MLMQPRYQTTADLLSDLFHIVRIFCIHLLHGLTDLTPDHAGHFRHMGQLPPTACL